MKVEVVDVVEVHHSHHDPVVVKHGQDEHVEGHELWEDEHVGGQVVLRYSST